MHNTKHNNLLKSSIFAINWLYAAADWAPVINEHNEKKYNWLNFGIFWLINEPGVESQIIIFSCIFQRDISHIVYRIQFDTLFQRQKNSILTLYNESLAIFNELESILRLPNKYQINDDAVAARE